MPTRLGHHTCWKMVPNVARDVKSSGSNLTILTLRGMLCKENVLVYQYLIHCVCYSLFLFSFILHTLSVYPECTLHLPNGEYLPTRRHGWLHVVELLSKGRALAAAMLCEGHPTHRFSSLQQAFAC